MNKLSSILVATVFALSGASALAADPPKAEAGAKKTEAAAPLKKPASVTQEAWDKMSDADKKKAVEKAEKEGTKSAAAPKKEKKGGC